MSAGHVSIISCEIGSSCYYPCAGSGVVRIALSVVYPSMFFFIVLLFIRAPFCVLIVFAGMYSVFWLSWLSCHYLPSDRLERLL